MKQLTFLSFLFLLISCNDDELSIDLTNVTLKSTIQELDNGSLEYPVFEVEKLRLRTVNTHKNPLREYSLGLQTYTDEQGTPIGVGLASLTSDLEFIDLGEFAFDEITSFPDSLTRMEIGIEVSEGSVIGVISKSKQLKLKVNTATFGLDDRETPQSEINFSAEYL